MANGRRVNPVYRSISRPLTILGAERKLFFFAMCIGAGTFNLLGSLLGGVLMFFRQCQEECDSKSWPQDRGISGCFSTEVSDSDEGTRKTQRGSDASLSAQPHRATPSFRFRLCLWFTPHPTATGLCR